jgi:tryptophan-rich sensory protein
MMNRRLSLAVFLLAVVGTGWLIGATNLPGAWYASLRKPSFNPPNWLFAPTWTGLLHPDRYRGVEDLLQERNSLPMQLWFLQMLLNFSWSPVFFRLHNMTLGLAIILALLATIVGFIWVQAGDGSLYPLRRVGKLCINTKLQSLSAELTAHFPPVSDSLS